jgi:hypothetical protein
VYPAIIQSAFGVFSCKRLADGSTRFSLAPHLDCDSDEAHVAKAVAAASLGIWGVGFPLLLGALIHRFSNNPKYSFSIVSYGYKPTLRFWEAWECLKKFGILLIITFLRETPELAAIILLLFLCFVIASFALCEPFISSLVNKAHLACDFLVVLVLLAGSLSTWAGKKWPANLESSEALSVVVVTYAACLLSGLIAVLFLETGSVFHKGGRRHALWNSFLIGHAAAVATAKRLSRSFSTRVAKRLSSFAGFSSAIVPEAAGARAALTVVQVRSAAATEDAANDSAQLGHVRHAQLSALSKMHAKVRSLAENPILADVDDDLRIQLEKCAIKLEALLVDNVRPASLSDEYITGLQKMHVEVLSLTADAMLAQVDDGDNLKAQLEKCALRLQTLVRKDGPPNLRDERAVAEFADEYAS